MKHMSPDSGTGLGVLFSKKEHGRLDGGGGWWLLGGNLQHLPHPPPPRLPACGGQDSGRVTTQLGNFFFPDSSDAFSDAIRS